MTIHETISSTFQTLEARLAKTYEVWHRATPTFFNNDDATLAAFPEGFVHVADVQAEAVGQVFQLTNSIDCGWWENPEVTVTPAISEGPGGVRSTSVGDVIVKALASRFDEAAGRPVFQRWSIEMIGLREF